MWSLTAQRTFTTKYEKRAVNFLEPVRNAIGNNHGVAGNELAGFAAGDFAAANFIGGDVLAVNHRSAGDDGGAAFENVEDVGIFRMHFDYAGLFAAAGVHHVIASAVIAIEKHGALGEAFFGLFLREIADGEKSGGHDRIIAEFFCGFGAGNGQLFILRRAHGTAHAADNLAVESNGDASLQRSEEGIRKSSHGRAAFVDDVFEDLRGLLEENGGARFADGDVGTGGKSAVEALERH